MPLEETRRPNATSWFYPKISACSQNTIYLNFRSPLTLTSKALHSPLSLVYEDPTEVHCSHGQWLRASLLSPFAG